MRGGTRRPPLTNYGITPKCAGCSTSCGPISTASHEKSRRFSPRPSGPTAGKNGRRRMIISHDLDAALTGIADVEICFCANSEAHNRYERTVCTLHKYTRNLYKHPVLSATTKPTFHRTRDRTRDRTSHNIPIRTGSRSGHQNGHQTD